MAGALPGCSHRMWSPRAVLSVGAQHRNAQEHAGIVEGGDNPHGTGVSPTCEVPAGAAQVAARCLLKAACAAGTLLLTPHMPGTA